MLSGRIQNKMIIMGENESKTFESYSGKHEINVTINA